MAVESQLAAYKLQDPLATLQVSGIYGNYSARLKCSCVAWPLTHRSPQTQSERADSQTKGKWIGATPCVGQ
jgi:hypothetical protein